MHPVHLHRNYMTYRNHAAANRNAPPRESILRRWIRARVRAWQRRKMIAALHAMDDRLLRDIGIERSRIPEVVDGLDDRELRMRPVSSRDASAIDRVPRRAPPSRRAA